MQNKCELLPAVPLLRKFLKGRIMLINVMDLFIQREIKPWMENITITAVHNKLLLSHIIHYRENNHSFKSFIQSQAAHDEETIA